ncbi:hypothetical protein JI735_33710 (plasmid) [Paenibacillus sonchi]|uniref:Uncharacterized protein n=1 Tax=Paenibacillus sonchi TaxID=373687 RepID=A0A974PIH5_9BACL|nr:hypothetical protein [Paenibacillus sonchi]QQZ64609.1 hypothetical protein JI735_33710 [Paenibacillus sonchi]
MVEIQPIITGFKMMQMKFLLEWVCESVSDAKELCSAIHEPHLMDQASIEEISEMLRPLLNTTMKEHNPDDELSFVMPLRPQDWSIALETVIRSLERYQMDTILKMVRDQTNGSLEITGFYLGAEKYEPFITPIYFQIQSIDKQLSLLQKLKEDYACRIERNKERATETNFTSYRWLSTIDTGILILKHLRYHLLVEQSSKQNTSYQPPREATEPIKKMKKELPNWITHLMENAK